MKTINLSDKDYEFLIELSKEINTQDSRATACPYFYQIQTNEEIAVPNGCGTEAWHYDGSKLINQSEIDQAIFDYYDPEYTIEQIQQMDEWDKFDILEKIGYNKINFDYKHEYQNAFLTEKACKEHIRLNSYHYSEPVDYVSHAFRNPELETLLNIIKRLR